MKCPACGSLVELSGVFPGGRARCACGHELLVPMVRIAAAAATDPYRSPSPRLGEARAGETSRAASGPLCPACPLPLVTCTLDGFALSACSAGHGLFVEPDVLEALLRHAAVLAGAAFESSPPKVSSSPAPVRYVRCPACSEVMDRRLFAGSSGVIVDVCAHGTWFDAGELAQALAFAASGRMPDGPTLGPRAAPSASSPHAKAALDAALLADAARERTEVRHAEDMLQDGIDLLMLLLGVPRAQLRQNRW